MTAKKNVVISDPTLRDGNHAASHKITPRQIAEYCRRAEVAGVPIVEVGHGNGIGASSLQLGLAAASDVDLLSAARGELKNSQLGVHVIPGFATVDKDIKPAIEIGVDVFRIGTHCSEADTSERFLNYLRNQGKTAYGVLMMSHMVSPAVLVEEAQKMETYGAEAIMIMDSAGAFLPDDVTARIGALTERLGIRVGFHAHNNLGCAIANSIAAVKAGATILDGSARGFGAGAGNAQLEVLVAVLRKLGYETGIDLYKVLDLADLAESEIMERVPTISSPSIVSGLAGVFSGFLKPVQRIAGDYQVDPRDVFMELGRRGVVAGQEDLILEVAQNLARETKVA